jgi:hypothetical protein
MRTVPPIPRRAAAGPELERIVAPLLPEPVTGYVAGLPREPGDAPSFSAMILRR